MPDGREIAIATSRDADRIEVHRTPVGFSEGRRFAAVFAATAILLLSSTMALNYVVNPRGEFSTHFFTPIALYDPPMKDELFQNLGPVDTLVVGSSRSMTLSSDALSDPYWGRVFNFGLTSSLSADARGIYADAVAEGKTPKRLIFGVEDWQLENQGDPKWEPYHEAKAGNPTRIIERLTSSISFIYTWESVKTVYYSVRSPSEPAYVFAPDGSMHFLQAERARQNGTLDLPQVIHAQMARKASQYHQIGDQLYPPRVEDLRALVTEARAHNTEVFLFFPPLHPQAIGALSNTSFAQLHEQTMSELRALCAPGVHVYDYLSTSSFGGNEAEFVDGWHYVGTNPGLLAKSLLQHHGDEC